MENIQGPKPVTFWRKSLPTSSANKKLRSASRRNTTGGVGQMVTESEVKYLLIENVLKAARAEGVKDAKAHKVHPAQAARKFLKRIGKFGGGGEHVKENIARLMHEAAVRIGLLREAKEMSDSKESKKHERKESPEFERGEQEEEREFGKKKVVMSKKSFKNEHKHLLKVLKRGKRSELSAERKKQTKEMKESAILGQLGKSANNMLFRKKRSNQQRNVESAPITRRAALIESKSQHIHIHMGRRKDKSGGVAGAVARKESPEFERGEQEEEREFKKKKLHLLRKKKLLKMKHKEAFITARANLMEAKRKKPERTSWSAAKHGGKLGAKWGAAAGLVSTLSSAAAHPGVTPGQVLVGSAIGAGLGSIVGGVHGAQAGVMHHHMRKHYHKESSSANKKLRNASRRNTTGGVGQMVTESTALSADPVQKMLRNAKEIGLKTKKGVAGHPAQQARKWLKRLDRGGEHSAKNIALVSIKRLMQEASIRLGILREAKEREESAEHEEDEKNPKHEAAESRKKEMLERRKKMWSSQDPKKRFLRERMKKKMLKMKHKESFITARANLMESSLGLRAKVLTHMVGKNTITGAEKAMYKKMGGKKMVHVVDSLNPTHDERTGPALLPHRIINRAKYSDLARNLLGTGDSEKAKGVIGHELGHQVVKDSKELSHVGAASNRGLALSASIPHKEFGGAAEKAISSRGLPQTGKAVGSRVSRLFKGMTARFMSVPANEAHATEKAWGHIGDAGKESMRKGFNTYVDSVEKTPTVQKSIDAFNQAGGLGSPGAHTKLYDVAAKREERKQRLTKKLKGIVGMESARISHRAAFLEALNPLPGFTRKVVDGGMAAIKAAKAPATVASKVAGNAASHSQQLAAHLKAGGKQADFKFKPPFEEGVRPKGIVDRARGKDIKKTALDAYNRKSGKGNLSEGPVDAAGKPIQGIGQQLNQAAKTALATPTNIGPKKLTPGV